MIITIRSPRRRWVLLFLLLGMTTVAKAGCDSCLQASINSTNTAIEGAIQGAQQSLETLVQQTETLNTNLQQNTQALSTLQTNNTEQINMAIASAGEKLKGSNLATSKSIQMLFESMTSTIVSTLKGLAKKNEVMRNNDMLGPQSMTMTGEVAINRVESLVAAMGSYHEIRAKELNKFHQWAFLGLEEFIYEETVKELTEFDPEELRDNLQNMNKSLLSEEETSILLRTLKFSLLPVPPNFRNTNEATKIRIIKRMQELVQTYAVYVDHVLDRAPLLQVEDWDIGYVSILKDENNFTSIREYVDSETSRKMLSPDWYMDIKTRNTVGLAREMVYQTDMQNMLLQQLIDLQQQELLQLSNQ